MLEEIKQVSLSAELLHSEAEVEAALKKMAKQINRQLANTNPVLLCVMNGGIITAGKLMPLLDFPLTLDTINASRYQNQTSGGEIKWLVKPESSLQGRTILIVDDILDEGITLEAIIQYCKQQGAKKVYSAVLVDKIINKSKPISADFVALQVADRYIFGYGMDYKGYLRNAAGIFACLDEI